MAGFSLSGPSVQTSTPASAPVSEHVSQYGYGTPSSGHGGVKPVPPTSPFYITFSELHSMLDRFNSSPHPPVEYLAKFLQYSTPRLASCGDPFPPFDSTSPSISSGRISLRGGMTAKVNPNELELCKKISKKFDITETDAVILFRNFRRHSMKEDEKEDIGRDFGRDFGKKSKNGSDDEAFWEEFLRFYFKERLGVMGIVSLLFIHADNPGGELYPLAKEILSIISPQTPSSQLSPTTSTNAASSGTKATPAVLLSHFLQKTKRPFPSQVRADPRLATAWAEHWLAEQKAILGVIFLLWYSWCMPDGDGITRLLSTIKETHWGQLQEHSGYHNQDSKSLVAEISNLLVIISVEALNLDNVVSNPLRLPTPNYSNISLDNRPSSPSSTIPEKGHLLNPKTLGMIHGMIIDLAESDLNRTNPLLLGWSLILMQLTDGITQNGVNEAYHDFAVEILQKSSGRSERRRSRSNLGASLSSSRGAGATAETEGSGGSRPLWWILLNHVIQDDGDVCRCLVLSTLKKLLLAPPISSIGLPSPSGIMAPSKRRKTSTITLRKSIVDVRPLVSEGASSTSDQNSFGYLAVLSTLLLSVPALIKPVHLHPAQYESLIDVFCTLQGIPDSLPLRQTYWSLPEPAEDGGEEEPGPKKDLLELARKRWPVKFGGLVRILVSLGGDLIGIDDQIGSDLMGRGGSEVGRECSERVFEYLENLPSITHTLPRQPLGSPPPYETEASDPSLVICAREIQISKSLKVRKGTVGRIVSKANSRPVVICWKGLVDEDGNMGEGFVEGWSGWRFFVDVLEEFAGIGSSSSSSGGGSGAGMDVFGIGREARIGSNIVWDSEDEKLRDIGNMLDLFAITFSNDLGDQLVRHIAATSRGRVNLSSASSSDADDLVQNLFRILERCLMSNEIIRSRRIVACTLNVISALLSTFPGGIWTFIRGSTVLFPPSPGSSAAWMDTDFQDPILKTEKTLGRYQMTIALLGLIEALSLEAQRSTFVLDPSFAEVKKDVLLRALRWVRDDVWASHGAWSYELVGEKVEIGRRSVNIFNLAMDDGVLAMVAGNGKAVDGGAPGVGMKALNDLDQVFKSIALVDAPLSRLAPLVTTIGGGVEAVTSFDEAGRKDEASRSEKLIEGSILLARRLIAIRRKDARYPPLTSPLEKCFFATEAELVSSLSATARTRKGLIPTLTTYITTSFSSSLSCEAARLLTLLAEASSSPETSAWDPNRPSLMQVLGGTEETTELVTSFLAILADEGQDSSVQLAVWDLLTTITESHPGLGSLIVTGSYLPTSVKNSKQGREEDGQAIDLRRSRGTLRDLDETAVDVAIGVLERWEELWKENPSRLAAAVCFAAAVWQRLLEYGTALGERRRSVKLWDIIERLIITDIGSALGPIFPREAEEKADRVRDYCYRSLAKSSAALILAADISYSTQVQTSQQGLALSDLPSLKAMERLASTRPNFLGAITAALTDLTDANQHKFIIQAIAQTFRGFPAEAILRTGASDLFGGSKEYGTDFHCPPRILRRRFEGFLSGSIDAEAIAQATKGLAAVNLMASLQNVQVMASQSWRRLMDSGLGPLRDKVEVCRTIASVSAPIASLINDEAGSTAALYDYRLQALLSMVSPIFQSPVQVPPSEPVLLVAQLERMVSSEAFRPIESLRRQSKAPYHRTILRILLLTFRKFRATVAKDPLDASKRLDFIGVVEPLGRFTINFLAEILRMALTIRDASLEDDLFLTISLFQEMADGDPGLPLGTWISLFVEYGIFHGAFEVFARMTEVDGRPAYSKQVLVLFLFIARLRTSAEYAASEGIMTAFVSNPMTPHADRGTLTPTLPGHSHERNPYHEVWTWMLAVVSSLVTAMDHNSEFADTDVTAFVRLYSAQISRPLLLSVADPLPIPALEELHNAVALLHAVTVTGSDDGAVSIVMQNFGERLAGLTQNLVWAVTHPNNLADLLHPVTSEEKAWMHRQTQAGSRLSKILTQELLQLCSILVDTLVTIGRVDLVLTGDPSQWPVHRILIAPTSGTRLTEPASFGTLYELANACVDILKGEAQDFQAVNSHERCPPPLSPYNPALMKEVASQTLESVLALASTQMALHLASQSGATAARARRDIIARLGPELQSLLEQAGHVASTSGTAKGKAKPGSSTGGSRFLDLLAQFVERVLS